MLSDGLPCADDSGITGAVRSWSEDPLTARARSIWTAGDFLPIARSYAPGAREFVARLELRPGESVLDVACGTGNTTIPAAEAGARAIGVDLVPYLIAHARLEARTAGFMITFAVGDAEALAFADDRFETTMSMFGAMFADRPERVAAELLRVTRPGGRVAMANWTPEGLVGRFLQAHATLVPPPSGVPSPLEWGREEVVRARFGDRVSSLTCVRRSIEMQFPFGPAAVTELFASCYGPTVTTLQTLDPDGASLLRHRLTRLFQQHNQATNGTTALAAEYLEIQAQVA